MAFSDDSTPDKTSVSSKSAFGMMMLTISSAEAGEKHITISTISVILSKFLLKVVSRSAAVLPVSRCVRPFFADRFCGSCGSGKPRRPDCLQKPCGIVRGIAGLLYVCPFDPHRVQAPSANLSTGLFRQRKFVTHL